MKKQKNVWPNSPDSSEVIRRLNWFMLAGFIIERIDFSVGEKQVTMTGDCQWKGASKTSCIIGGSR